MNYNEQYYRRVISAIGLTMLLFLLCFNIFAFASSFVLILTSMLFPSPAASEIVYQLFYGAGYLLSFMLPVLLLKKRIAKAGYAYLPMQTSTKLSPVLFLMIPAVIFVNFSAAYLNAAIVSIFDYSAFTSELLGDMEGTPPPYQWVLEFITLCVVPGFCEEFLFRGAIQTNCRPFGRTNAILISAFLFALMHQNAGQVLYTFVTGIFLGLIYEKTGSIWPSTVLHILNNFISTFETMIFYKEGAGEKAELLLILFESLLFAVGAIALAILIEKLFVKKDRLQDGVFGKDLPACDGYAAAPVAPKRALKLFFAPSMVIFAVVAILEMLLLLLLALGAGYVGF